METEPIDNTSPSTWEILGPTGGTALPLVIHVPHASTWIPPEERADIVLSDDELAHEHLLLVDAHVDQLFAPARALGATLFVNRLSRLVIDPERFPDDKDEPAAAWGMGAVYTHTQDGRPLRRADWSPADRERLMQRYYRPYAAAMESLVRTQLERHGACWILDAHSFPSRPLGFEDPAKARPAICIGHTDGQTLSYSLTWWRLLAFGRITGLSRAAEEVLERPGRPFLKENEPFAGSYVPLAYAGDRRVPSLMIEVNRSLYMDEKTGESFLTRPRSRQPLETRVLLDILAEFLDHAAMGMASQLRMNASQASRPGWPADPSSLERSGPAPEDRSPRTERPC